MKKYLLFIAALLCLPQVVFAAESEEALAFRECAEGGGHSSTCTLTQDITLEEDLEIPSDILVEIKAKITIQKSLTISGSVYTTSMDNFVFEGEGVLIIDNEDESVLITVGEFIDSNLYDFTYDSIEFISNDIIGDMPYSLMKRTKFVLDNPSSSTGGNIYYSNNNNKLSLYVFDLALIYFNDITINKNETYEFDHSYLYSGMPGDMFIDATLTNNGNLVFKNMSSLYSINKVINNKKISVFSDAYLNIYEDYYNNGTTEAYNTSALYFVNGVKGNEIDYPDGRVDLKNLSQDNKTNLITLYLDSPETFDSYKGLMVKRSCSEVYVTYDEKTLTYNFSGLCAMCWKAR